MDETNLNFNNKFNSIIDNYAQVAIPEKKKIRSERAELVEFFIETLRNKDGKKFPVKTIIFKLSHIPTKDLYFVKSVFEDNLKRKGLESASKEFWWSLKIQ